MVAAQAGFGVSCPLLNQLPCVVPPVVQEEFTVVSALHETGAATNTALHQGGQELVWVAVPLGGICDVCGVVLREVAVHGIVESPPPEQVEVANGSGNADS